MERDVGSTKTGRKALMAERLQEKGILPASAAINWELSVPRWTGRLI
jgi:hypothetical protein